MPRQPHVHVPQYPDRPHASGQAHIRLNGDSVYLGPWSDDPEAPSRKKYQTVIAEWLGNGATRLPPPGPDLTVVEVIDAYVAYAIVYYGGSNRGQIERVKLALAWVRELYGHERARAFSAKKLKAVRQRWIDAGWCRNYCNSCLGCVKRCFSWAVTEDLVPASVTHSLRELSGLEEGRSEARETEEVERVPEEWLPLILAQASRQVRALIELQLYTAARPGEALAIKPRLVDRSGPVWFYRPAQYKTKKSDKKQGFEMPIYIGPKAQALLAPWLLREPDAYCFSPREAVEEYLGDRGLPVRHARGRRPGDHYRVDSYDRAIAAACRRAFPPPADLADTLARARAARRRARMRGDVWELSQAAESLAKAEEDVKAWHKGHHVHPHQFRHNAGCRLEAEFGYEVARIILRHKHLNTTKIYAPGEVAKAIAAISRVG